MTGRDVARCGQAGAAGPEVTTVGAASLRRIAAGAALVWAWWGSTAHAGEASPAGRAVLETASPWRVFCMWKTELVRSASGDLEPVKVRVGRAQWKHTPLAQTAPPPAGWTGVDFDDGDWVRLHGPLGGGGRNLALVCLRGRFGVTDPAGAPDLTLGLSYRGGVVVHLNGKEVARRHLPGGRIDPQTPAEDYPPEAYVDTDGHLLRHGFGDPQKYADRLALRTRRLTGLKLPPELLRKGVNVLAVELHRAPTAEVLITGKSRTMMSTGAAYSQWSMLAMEDLRLSAPGAAKAFAASVARPDRLVAWTDSVVRRVSVSDFPDPHEPLRPMRIVGVRNGAFAGQVVLSAARTIRGLDVRTGDLKLSGGESVIPAAAVQVRYGLPDGQAHRQPAWFDGLADSPPGEPAAGGGGGSVQPVWVTVRVPSDARAGRYEGSITLAVRGAGPVVVPVRLRVLDWTLPDRREFVSHVGLIQSPESLALQYDAPMWSDRHWKLLGAAFTLLGEAGADDVYVPLIARTAHGNEHGMVRWVRRGDGGYDYDLSIAERYLDLAVEHLGNVPVVCLYLWDRQGGGWMGWGTRHFEQQAGPPVSVLDRATGKLSSMEAPKWGTPESRPFWRPVIEALRNALEKRKLVGSMMFGVALDARPPKETIDDLKAIAPDVPWVLHSHSGPQNIHGQPVGYGAHVHFSRSLADPSEKRSYGWQHPYVFTAFPRYGAGGAGAIRGGKLGICRWLIEGLTVTGHRGFGRVGADFWPVLGPAGRKATVYGRFGFDKLSIRLKDSSPALLAPGPDGPLSTVRLEMIREGAQETEARVFLEKALADPAKRRRLGAPLAERCQALLDERVRRMLLMACRPREQAGFLTNWELFPAGDWQQQSEALYAVAAEVAARLSGSGQEP